MNSFVTWVDRLANVASNLYSDIMYCEELENLRIRLGREFIEQSSTFWSGQHIVFQHMASVHTLSGLEVHVLRLACVNVSGQLFLVYSSPPLQLRFEETYFHHHYTITITITTTIIIRNSSSSSSTAVLMTACQWARGFLSRL